MSPHAIESLLADYHGTERPRRPLTIKQAVRANARATNERIAEILRMARVSS